MRQWPKYVLSVSPRADILQETEANVAAAPPTVVAEGDAPLTEQDLDRSTTVFLRETETHILLDMPMLVIGKVRLHLSFAV